MKGMKDTKPTEPKLGIEEVLPNEAFRGGNLGITTNTNMPGAMAGGGGYAAIKAASDSRRRQRGGMGSLKKLLGKENTQLSGGTKRRRMSKMLKKRKNKKSRKTRKNTMKRGKRRGGKR